MPAAGKTEIEKAARDTVKRIGDEQEGFHWETAELSNFLHGQSAHIAQGVDASGNKAEGEGDQGIMLCHACNETHDHRPATLSNTHKVLAQKEDARKRKADSILEPDDKRPSTPALDNERPDQ